MMLMLPVAILWALQAVQSFVGSAICVMRVHKTMPSAFYFSRWNTGAQASNAQGAKRGWKGGSFFPGSQWCVAEYSDGHIFYSLDYLNHTLPMTCFRQKDQTMMNRRVLLLRAYLSFCFMVVGIIANNETLETLAQNIGFALGLLAHKYLASSPFHFGHAKCALVSLAVGGVVSLAFGQCSILSLFWVIRPFGTGSR